jgi:hypothetical protein
MKKISLIPVLAVVLLTACTWVKPTDAGQDVRVASYDQVDQCKKIGRTTVSVLDEVAYVSRSEDSVAEELKTLARNSGASMGGNTVVAAGAVSKGEQSFDVFQCER